MHAHRAQKGGSWVWERRKRDFYGPVERACKVCICMCVYWVIDGANTHTVYSTYTHRHDFPTQPINRPQVFCEGDLLDAVQMAGIFEDSKEFVDMPLRFDPEYVLEVRMTTAPTI